MASLGLLEQFIGLFKSFNITFEKTYNADRREAKQQIARFIRKIASPKGFQEKK